MQRGPGVWHDGRLAGRSGVMLTGSQQAPGKGYLELALDPDINRTGDVWHVCLPGLRDASQLCFGWRADSASCTEFVPGAAVSSRSRLRGAQAASSPCITLYLSCPSLWPCRPHE